MRMMRVTEEIIGMQVKVYLVKAMLLNKRNAASAQLTPFCVLLVMIMMMMMKMLLMMIMMIMMTAKIIGMQVKVNLVKAILLNKRNAAPS